MTGNGLQFSAILRQLMQERYLSIDRLARLSGVHRSTIYRWRQGRVGRAYNLEGMLRIASALELDRLTTNYLLNAARLPVLDVLEQTAGEPAVRRLIARWQPATHTNLPAELTTFVGREEDVLTIARLLRDREARLVTLTGPGGSGKTRLARQAARQLLDIFNDGVLYVALEELNAPDEVLPHIARQVGLRAAPGAAAGEQLAGYLGSRRTLLVLDNLEHLIESGPALVELLRAAPQLAILATSRLPLRITGEQVYPVDPFPVPPAGASLDELRDSPAITLFRQRARAVNPALDLDARGLRAVRDICERLDGIPLGIELAAARCGRFPLEELLERFPSGLALAAEGPRDAAQRQRTLRDTIGWSFDLLEPQDRTLLARLPVFAGSWRGRSAAEICALPDDDPQLDVMAGLSRLVAAGLVQPNDVPGRFQLLETIREFAHERLKASGEEPALRERHARYYLALAEDREVPYVPGLRSGRYFRRCNQNEANFRAALEWAREHDRAALARLAAALWPYWHEYALFPEGRAWLAEARSSPDRLPPRIEAEILTGELLLAYSESDHGAAGAAGRAALALWRELDDDHGQAITLLYLGQVAFVTGRFDDTGTTLVESLGHWRALGYPPGTARCLSELAVLLFTTGQFDQAGRVLQEAQSIYEREGLRDGQARSLVDRGLSLMMAGRPAEAIPLLEDGLKIAREAEAGPVISAGLFYLGTSLCFAGQLEAARGPLEESLRLRFEARDRYGAGYTLLAFAALAWREDDPREAARLAGAATGMLETSGIVMNPGMQEIYRSEIAAVRDQIGDEFDAAFEEGRRLRFARIVDEALG